MCPWDSLLRFPGCPGCPCWRENLAQRHPGIPETPAKRHWLAIQEIVAGWSGRSAVQKLGAEILKKKWDSKNQENRLKSTQIDSIDFDLSRFGALVQLIKILQPSWKKLTLPWPGQRAHEEVLPLGLASLPWKLCHRRKRRNMEKVWVTGRITANKTLANFADNEWFHHETKSKLAKD